MKCTPTAKFWMVFTSFAIVLTSCTNHIYNPALNLPAKPLQQGEVNVSGNFGYAPEANAAATSSIVSPMGAVSVRVGIIDNLMLQAEGWTDFTPDDFFSRGGYAFSVMYTFSKAENSLFTYGIMPKYGFVLSGSNFFDDGITVGGHGFGLSFLAYLNREEYRTKPYFGITPIYGFRNLENINDNDGHALALQAGLNYEFNSWLNLNVELPLVYQYNNSREIAHLIPAPTIGFNVDLSIVKNDY